MIKASPRDYDLYDPFDDLAFWFLTFGALTAVILIVFLVVKAILG